MKFIQKIRIKKGALHEQLGIPKSRKIPVGLLNKIGESRIGNHVTYLGKKIKVTRLLKRRALLAVKLKKVKR